MRFAFASILSLLALAPLAAAPCVCTPAKCDCSACPADCPPGKPPVAGYVWHNLPGVGWGWCCPETVKSHKAGKLNLVGGTAAGCVGGKCPTAPASAPVPYTLPGFPGSSCPGGTCNQAPTVIRRR